MKNIWVTGCTWWALPKPRSLPESEGQWGNTNAEEQRGEGVSLEHSPPECHRDAGGSICHPYCEICLPEWEESPDHSPNLLRCSDCFQCPFDPAVWDHVIGLAVVYPRNSQIPLIFLGLSLAIAASIVSASRHPLLPLLRAFCSSGSRFLAFT